MTVVWMERYRSSRCGPCLAPTIADLKKHEPASQVRRVLELSRSEALAHHLRSHLVPDLESEDPRIDAMRLPVAGSERTPRDFLYSGALTRRVHPREFFELHRPTYRFEM